LCWDGGKACCSFFWGGGFFGWVMVILTGVDWILQICMWIYQIYLHFWTFVGWFSIVFGGKLADLTDSGSIFATDEKCLMHQFWWVHGTQFPLLKIGSLISGL
jgi:hypothetical protein